MQRSMKSVKKLFLFAFVGMVGFAYSCKKNTDVQDPQVTVSLTPTSGAAGDQITISVVASADPSRNITKLVVDAISSNPVGSVNILDSTLKKNNVGYTYTYTIPSGNTGTIQIKATVTDDGSVTASGTADITITSAQQLRDDGSSDMGAQNNTGKGSFYSTSEGTVYLSAAAKTNQAKVDFVYYYGTNNMATLAAPSDASVDGGSGHIDLGIQTWTVKNGTMFKKTSGADYDNATASSVELAYNNASASADTKANTLASGDIIAFKTGNGKYGLIRITNITGTDTGSCTVEVKVQK
jgi:hypothetical protein